MKRNNIITQDWNVDNPNDINWKDQSEYDKFEKDAIALQKKYKITSFKRPLGCTKLQNAALDHFYKARLSIHRDNPWISSDKDETDYKLDQFGHKIYKDGTKSFNMSKIDMYEGTKNELGRLQIWAMALLFANSLDPITEEQFQVYIGDNYFRAKKKRRELGVFYYNK